MLHEFLSGVKKDGNILDDIKGSHETLGGLIFELNNTFPKPPAGIFYKQFNFNIESNFGRSVKRIEVHITDEES